MPKFAGKIFKKKKAKQVDLDALIKQKRELTGPFGYVVMVVAIIMSGYFVYISGFGATTYELPRYIYLLGTLILAFAIYPATNKSPRNRVTIVDCILIVLSIITMTYWVFENSTYWIQRPASPTDLDIFMGAILIFLCLELARRVLGWPLVILSCFFLFQLVLGPRLPGILAHRGFTILRTVEFMYWSREAIFGQVMGIFIRYVFPFIIFGAFLNGSGGGPFFIAIANAIAGKKRGGPALIAVLASAFFGSISGAPVANAVATGTFTIPLMKKVGYDAQTAAAVEATASTGGQLMPPVMGASAFVLATLTETPYSQVMIMALGPAIIFFLYVGLSVYFYARRHNIQGLSDDEVPKIFDVLRKGWYYLGAPLILFGMILKGFSPAISAYWAILFLVASVFLTKSTRRKILTIVIDSLIKAAKDNLMVASVIGAIGIIYGGITFGGLGLRFSSLVLDIAGGNLFATVWLALFVGLILGMGMPTTAAYIIMAILVAPAFIRLGVPMLSAHFAIFWLAVTSNVTPPVCVTAFAASSVANSDPFKTGLKSAKMSIILYALPFVFIYFPEILLIGEAFDIVIAFASYFLAAFCLAVLAEGWLIRKLKIWERILFLAFVVALFFSSMVTLLAISAVLIIVVLMLKKQEDQDRVIPA